MLRSNADMSHLCPSLSVVSSCLRTSALRLSVVCPCDNAGDCQKTERTSGVCTPSGGSPGNRPAKRRRRERVVCHRPTLKT